jgi:hypothetical protein
VRPLSHYYVTRLLKNTNSLVVDDARDAWVHAVLHLELADDLTGPRSRIARFHQDCPNVDLRIVIPDPELVERNIRCFFFEG